MDLMQAATQRHSVRQYVNKTIDDETAKALQATIDECNANGLHFQLILNEPKAFDGFMAKYGKFSDVQNYIALVGKKGNNADEKIGYYGAKVMLVAQTLGLNTCRVAMSYKKIKTAFVVDDGEKLFSVLALGYGKTQGVQHKSKLPTDVGICKASQTPDWFTDGIKTALLAPTAMNQQKFRFTLEADGKLQASAGMGFYTKMDLGIAKYFFELGANIGKIDWK